MDIFQFFIICKRTNNVNNATHYVKLGKKRWESSKRNYYIISPRVILKAMVIITPALTPHAVVPGVARRPTPPPPPLVAGNTVWPSKGVEGLFIFCCACSSWRWRFFETKWVVCIRKQIEVCVCARSILPCEMHCFNAHPVHEFKRVYWNIIIYVHV